MDAPVVVTSRMKFMKRAWQMLGCWALMSFLPSTFFHHCSPFFCRSHFCDTSIKDTWQYSSVPLEEGIRCSRFQKPGSTGGLTHSTFMSKREQSMMLSSLRKAVSTFSWAMNSFTIGCDRYSLCSSCMKSRSLQTVETEMGSSVSLSLSTRRSSVEPLRSYVRWIWNFRHPEMFFIRRMQYVRDISLCCILNSPYILQMRVCGWVLKWRQNSGSSSIRVWNSSFLMVLRMYLLSALKKKNYPLLPPPPPRSSATWYNCSLFCSRSKLQPTSWTPSWRSNRWKILGAQRVHLPSRRERRGRIRASCSQSATSLGSMRKVTSSWKQRCLRGLPEWWGVRYSRQAMRMPTSMVITWVTLRKSIWFSSSQMSSIFSLSPMSISSNNQRWVGRRELSSDSLRLSGCWNILRNSFFILLPIFLQSIITPIRQKNSTMRVRLNTVAKISTSDRG